jgi:hypothetical protein
MERRRRRQLEKLLIAVLPMLLSTAPCRLPMQQRWMLEKLPPVVMPHSPIHKQMRLRTLCVAG